MAKKFSTEGSLFSHKFDKYIDNCSMIIILKNKQTINIPLVL